MTLAKTWESPTCSRENWMKQKKELGEAVKVAEGGMHFERLRIQNAQNQLAKATKPEERQAAQNEISAAQKAGQIASKKYFRGKGLLNNVRVKMGKPAQP